MRDLFIDIIMKMYYNISKVCLISCIYYYFQSNTDLCEQQRQWSWSQKPVSHLAMSFLHR